MLLEVKNLTIGYKNPLINNLSFELSESEIIGISGKNGSGKTTLCLSLVNLLDEAFIEGSIKIDNQNIKDMSLADRCQSIGIVFQNPEEQIFSPTVEDEIVFGMENLCVAREEMIERLEEVLNLLGISHLQNEKTNHLSTGQKQLVAIASVLAIKPKIFIADEITSALDDKNKQRVRNVLKKYADKGNAVIIVAHSKEDLAICNRVLKLDGVRDEN